MVTCKTVHIVFKCFSKSELVKSSSVKLFVWTDSCEYHWYHLCACVCPCVRVCVCKSSSCLCYPFSATLPWRQCPPGVMGDECARAIYSLFLPPSIHPSPSLLLHLPLAFSLSLSLPSLFPPCNLSPSPSFLCSFFPSVIGLTLSSSKWDTA